MTIIKHSIFLTGICLSLLSCTYDKAELAQPKTNTTTAISFKKDITPILKTYCYGSGDQACHVTATNQGAAGDFTNYQGVKDRVSSFPGRVFANNGGMPPDYANSPTKLTAGAIDTLKKWVDAGALNN